MAVDGKGVTGCGKMRHVFCMISVDRCGSELQYNLIKMVYVPCSIHIYL